MPLLEIWKAAPASVAALGIEQIVATAGNGALTDESDCSSKLRQYLTAVASGKLAEYAESCLISKFTMRGFVLQDIVNEFGRRLGFDVENGRYQGVSSQIGFDGVWRAPSGHACIIEVKTSDVYSINLDKVAGYRTELMRQGRVNHKSSTLLVVGNADTGGLEAQVRGSRHAWDMRLISVRALADLVRLHEASRSPQTGTRIRTLLTPLEFTRLDGLAEVLLQTAEETADAREQALIEPDEEAESNQQFQTALKREPASHPESDASGSWQVTDPAVISLKRQRIVASVEARTGVSLVKRSKATFLSEDGKLRLACTISKLYPKPEYTYPYWYAFHPNWRDFIRNSNGYLALGFVDTDAAALLPTQFIEHLLPMLNTTTRRTGEMYWHIHLIRTEAGGLAIRLREGPPADLAPFMIEPAGSR